MSGYRGVKLRRDNFQSLAEAKELNTKVRSVGVGCNLGVFYCQGERTFIEIESS
jgi:hypothetical protein